jgi:hypothetical protein
MAATDNHASVLPVVPPQRQPSARPQPAPRGGPASQRVQPVLPQRPGLCELETREAFHLATLSRLKPICRCLCLFLCLCLSNRLPLFPSHSVPLAFRSLSPFLPFSLSLSLSLSPSISLTLSLSLSSGSSDCETRRRCCATTSRTARPAHLQSSTWLFSSW